MSFAGSKYSTNLGDKHCAFFLRNRFFTFFGSKIRIKVFQLLCSDEKDIIRKKRINIVVTSGNVFFCIFQSPVDFADSVLKCLCVTFFLRNYFFPVPLVNIQRMDVVCIFITTYRTHICVKPFAGMEIVILQCISLPFCKRMNDLCNRTILFFDVKGNRTFYAV